MNKPTKKRATKSAKDCSELDARFLGRLDSLVRLALPVTQKCLSLLYLS